MWRRAYSSFNVAVAGVLPRISVHIKESSLLQPSRDSSGRGQSIYSSSSFATASQLTRPSLLLMPSTASSETPGADIQVLHSGASRLRTYGTTHPGHWRGVTAEEGGHAHPQRHRAHAVPTEGQGQIHSSVLLLFSDRHGHISSGPLNISYRQQVLKPKPLWFPSTQSNIPEPNPEWLPPSSPSISRLSKASIPWRRNTICWTVSWRRWRKTAQSSRWAIVNTLWGVYDEFEFENVLN